MKHLLTCLFCVLVLLNVASLAEAVGKVTEDPNGPNAVPGIVTADTTDYRMDQKVTLVVSHKPVKTVLEILSASTKVTLQAGFTKEDWQVRDRKMTLAVRDMPLSEVMKTIAQVMKFKWSKSKKANPPTYRLYLDRQTLLGHDSLAYRAQEVYDDLCKSKRADFLQQLTDLENMSETDIEKLKDTNFYLYWLHQNGADKLANAMFREIPGLEESFRNKDTNLDTSASVLSEEAQQQLLRVVMERWKAGDQYHNSANPFPTDKIGPISEAELMMEFVPRPYTDWAQSNQHHDFGGIGVYLKDGFHKLAEFTDPTDPRASIDSKVRYESGISNEPRENIYKKYEAEELYWDQKDKKALEAIFPTEPDVEQPDEPDLHKKLKDIKPASEKMADVLVALSESSGFSIVSDSFASVKGSAKLANDIELKQALDTIAKAYRYNWQKKGNVITFRSRDWFSLRISQLPDEWVEAWTKDIEENEYMSLDTYSAIGRLDSKQIEENIKPVEVLNAAKVVDWPLIHARYMLILYTVLNSSQKKALFSPAGLYLKLLQPHQLEAARKAFRYRGEGRNDLNKISDFIENDDSLAMTMRAKYAKAGDKNCTCDISLIDINKAEKRKWTLVFPRYAKPGAAGAASPVTYWNEMIKSGKLKEAKALMDKALKDSPSRETADAVHAVLCDNGMAKEAITMWEARIKQAKAAGITPADEADYYTRLAWASGSAQDVAKEEEARKHVTEIGIKLKDARRINSLGWFYASKNMKLDEAIAIIKQAIALAPEDPGFHSALAMAQAKQGDYKSAIEVLEMCINKLKATENPVIRCQLAEAYAKTGKPTEAKTELGKAKELGYDPKEIERVAAMLK